MCFVDLVYNIHPKHNLLAVLLHQAWMDGWMVGV